MVEFITLATVILGCLLLLPLFVLGWKRPANAWLGLFVYAIVSLALADYCTMTGVYARYPWLWGWFDWPVAGIGAFFYCYVRSLLGLANGWRQFGHFVPVILFSGLLLHARLFLPEAGSSPLVQSTSAQDSKPVLLFFQLLTCGYALAVWYRLRQYRSRLRQHYSSTLRRDLIWLQWLTFAVVLLLVLWFPAVQAGGPWLMALIVGRIAVLYAFGWYGLRQQQVFLPSPPLVAAQVAADSAADVATETARIVLPNNIVTEALAVAAQSSSYARSGMTAAAQQLIGKRLVRRMSEDRDYLQNDLSLSELAERIGTSTQLLSEYLNVALQQNFFDYINSLRVAEVQRQLKSADLAKTNATLLSVAFAAGFNSKSTFNTAFRKHTGMTPSAWRALHCQNDVITSNADQSA